MVYFKFFCPSCFRNGRESGCLRSLPHASTHSPILFSLKDFLLQVSQQKNMFSIFWLSYICCFPDFQTSKGFHGSLHSLELPLWGHQESVRCYRNCRFAHFEAVGDANCHSHCRERWSIHNTSLLCWLPGPFFSSLDFKNRSHLLLNYSFAGSYL